MPAESANAANASSTRTKILVGATVLALVVLALFLRSYWNLDAAQTDEGFVMSAGSDPYYHFHAIRFIQENGWETLTFDPLLNYPYGSLNPNPPLFHWTVAVSGAAMAPFFDGGIEEATWWAMLWSPAVWGALAVIPTYLLGRDVFNRRTGVVAAFLMAVSTSAIDHTSLGAADHDPLILFFSVTAFWAYVRAIQSFRGDANWVTNWRDGSSVSSGFGRFFAERRTGLAWAAGAGLATAAVALVWKGFPYLIGIMFAYVAFQLVVDHWRSRDSMGVWLGTLVTFLVALIITTPVYLNHGIGSWLKPVWFLVVAYTIFGAVMVPTRDLPTILVLPLFGVVALLAAAASFFVVPDVARSLLYATVYFKQTTLYQTIAEAHPADFATMVFGVGPVAFFAALAGLVALIWHARKEPSRANLFMAVWAIIALYMAQSAVRFVFNAVPVLVVLGAWAITLVLDWADFSSVGKGIRNSSSFWSGFRRTVNGWHATVVVAVAALLVFPGVFLAVDAATPLAYDQEKAQDSEFYEKRFGAFGQGFLPAYWNDGLTWLAGLDDFGGNTPADFPNANRPGFISWWDYGHWAIQVGEHPAVADNFQNGYEYAANFLLAQNETQAIQLMSARAFDRQNEDGVRIATGLVDKETAKRLIAEAGVPEDRVDETFAQLAQWQYAPALGLEQAVALEALVQEATESDIRPDGMRIRYFATDVRMLPYDLPQTQFIDQTSIFYAPVVLKGDEPSDYVQLQIQGTDGNYYSEEEFEDRIRQITRYPNFGAAGQRYVYQDAFFNTMYYRGFVGTPVDTTQPPVLGDRLNQALATPQPGYEMKHWRLSYTNDQLRIMEYYTGAVLTGTVTEDGSPLSGARVTAYDDAGHILYEGMPEQIKNQTTADDFNVPHDSVFTDAEGKYRLVVPFSLDNGTTIVVTDSQGVELSRTTMQVTREQSSTAAALTHDFVVRKGNVDGFAFFDEDGDGTFNQSSEERVDGVEVSIGGVTDTTGADGSFSITDVSAGRRTVTVNSTEYEVAPVDRFVNVRPDTTVTHEVALTLRPVDASGVLTFDADGDGVESEGDAPASNVTVRFDPVGDDGRAQTALAGANGEFNADLVPGTYALNVTFTDDGVEYTTERQITVERGAALMEIGNVLLVREDDA